MEYMAHTLKYGPWSLNFGPVAFNFPWSQDQFYPVIRECSFQNEWEPDRVPELKNTHAVKKQACKQKNWRLILFKKFPSRGKEGALNWPHWARCFGWSSGKRRSERPQSYWKWLDSAQHLDMVDCDGVVSEAIWTELREYKSYSHRTKRKKETIWKGTEIT